MTVGTGIVVSIGIVCLTLIILCAIGAHLSAKRTDKTLATIKKFRDNDK